MKNVGAAIVLIGLCGLAFFGWKVWRELEIGGYESCIASAMSNTELRFTSGRIDLTAFDLPADGRWKLLSDAESESLLRQIQPGDCGRTKDIRFDLWGRRIHVVLRNSDEFLKVGIWSDGADAISGTDDDLTAPWGMRFQNGDFRRID